MRTCLPPVQKNNLPDGANDGSLFHDRLSKLQTEEEQLRGGGGGETNDDSRKSKPKNKRRQMCGEITLVMFSQANIPKPTRNKIIIIIIILLIITLIE